MKSKVYLLNVLFVFTWLKTHSWTRADSEITNQLPAHKGQYSSTSASVWSMSSSNPALISSMSLPSGDGTYTPNHSLPKHNNSTSVAIDKSNIVAQIDIALLANSHSSLVFTWNILLTLVLPYSIIFVLAVVGNLLVIVTLTLNRSMRSVTNIFLLNLAISDLLLGFFCMPFTLVGVLLQRFIFGPFMCHLISYLQAVSVAVSVWTLVAMSVERYYAICHPLRSRESRQTRQHACRILAIVWALAILLMSPTAIVSKLQSIPQTGNFKCREAWPSFNFKEAFTIFLDLYLLVIPLFIMILTYTSIAVTLTQSLHRNTSLARFQKRPSRIHKTTSFIESGRDSEKFCKLTHSSINSVTSRTDRVLQGKHLSLRHSEASGHQNSVNSKNFLNIPSCSKDAHSGDNFKSFYASIKSNNQSLRVNSNFCSIQARQRRVVVMLCVVVIEFFVCWTPIFIVDTLALYQPSMVYGYSKNMSRWIGIDIISACHLLCFCSSCTNPITYCFMNHRFRRHFCALFRCRNTSTYSSGPILHIPTFVSNVTNDHESEMNKDNSASFALDSVNQAASPAN